MFLILVQWLYMILIFNESTSISFGKLLEREKGERERGRERNLKNRRQRPKGWLPERRG